MLGDIASIATLIMFIIYFIGRIISINIEKNIKSEKIDLYYDENSIPNDFKIVDEFKCSNEGRDILILTPNAKSYNWVKVHECEYNTKKNKIIPIKELYKSGFIYNDTSFKIYTNLSCVVPNYSIEFERNDYIIGKLYLAYNGKNGIQEEMIQFHHTFKSIVYYLFR